MWGWDPLAGSRREVRGGFLGDGWMIGGTLYLSIVLQLICFQAKTGSVELRV